MKAPETATLTITTAQGKATVALAELAASGVQRLLGGRIEARRVPVHASVTATRAQEDFPAAVSDGRAGAWLVYVAHEPRGPEGSPNLAEEPASFKSYVPSGGGDQVKLVHFSGTTADRAFDVTDAGLDVWRPTVAREGRDGLVVVWSEFRDGNWDLYARRLNTAGGAWSGKPQRLTNDPGADTDAVLATGADGVVWMAWQAWRNGQADILLAPVDDLSRTVNVSDHPADDWSPSLAIGPQGRRSVAFDSYRNGSYDVLLYRGGDGNKRLTTVAGSTRFEVRPSLAIDAQGRTWVAYEERGDNWGKDFGVHADKPGVPLYQSQLRARGVRRRSEHLRHRRPGGPGHRARGRARRPDETRSPAWRSTAAAGPGSSIAAASRPTSRLPSCSREWAPPGWNTQPPGSVGPGLLPSRCPGAIISSTTAPRWSRSPAGRGRSWPSTPSDGRLHRDRGPGGHAPKNSAIKGAFARKEAAAAAVVRRTNNDIFVAALTAPAGAAEPTTGAPAVATAAAPSGAPQRGRGRRRAFAPTASAPAARPTSSSAASSIATPTSPPTAAATARSRTCGATPSTSPRSTGSAAATTTTATAASTPGGSPRRRPTSTTPRPGSTPCSPTSGASPTRAGTATSCSPSAGSGPCRGSRATTA